MRAAVVESAGSVPVCREYPDPPVIPGRQRLTMVAAGIHPLVRMVASGQHYSAGDLWPLVPGVDAVARTEAGHLVYVGFTVPPYGTLAEVLSAPPDACVPLPEGADPAAIAGAVNPGMSSFVPLRRRLADAGALGTVLILGATGMAGDLAVQTAFALGADDVIACGRNAAALDKVRGLGAKPCVMDGNPDVDGRTIRRALGSAEPTIVLDFVWGEPAEAAFAALARHGSDDDQADIEYVQIGSMAGPAAKVPAALLRSRRFVMRGHGIGSTRAAEMRAALPAFIDFAVARLDVHVRPYRLDEVGEAWQAAAEPGSRVVVVP